MKVKYLVVHCADTPDDRKVTASDIHSWHLARGWDGIGYHWVIGRDGELWSGRPEYWQGAHVAGHNHHSVGVCLVGRETYTQAQWNSLTSLIKLWLKKYPDAKLVGHRDLDYGKTCPNFDVKDWARKEGLI